jgi:hypothetical protein
MKCSKARSAPDACTAKAQASNPASHTIAEWAPRFIDDLEAFGSIARAAFGAAGLAHAGKATSLQGDPGWQAARAVTLNPRRNRGVPSQFAPEPRAARRRSATYRPTPRTANG